MKFLIVLFGLFGVAGFGLVTSAHADTMNVNVVDIFLGGADGGHVNFLNGSGSAVDTSNFALAASSNEDCTHNGVARRTSRGRAIAEGVDYHCPAGLTLNLNGTLHSSNSDSRVDAITKADALVGDLSDWVNHAQGCAAGGVITYAASGVSGAMTSDGDTGPLATGLKNAITAEPRIFAHSSSTAHAVSASGGPLLTALGVTSISCTGVDAMPSCTVTIPHTQKEACLAASRGGGASAHVDDGRDTGSRGEGTGATGGTGAPSAPRSRRL